jgi:hypothetical protein
MSVFPKSATFQSFFVVFVVLFLLTILLGLNLRKILLGFKTRSMTASSPLLAWLVKQSVKFGAFAKAYVKRYLRLLNPYDKNALDSFGLFSYLYILLASLPIRLLRHLVLPEICMPMDQVIMFRYRRNHLFPVEYHWLYFIKDVFRGILIPVWIGIAAGIVCYLVLLDILEGCLSLVFTPCMSEGGGGGCEETCNGEQQVAEA